MENAVERGRRTTERASESGSKIIIERLRDVGSIKEKRKLGHNAVSSASPLSIISNSSIDNVS